MRAPFSLINHKIPIFFLNLALFVASTWLLRLYLKLGRRTDAVTAARILRVTRVHNSLSCIENVIVEF